MRPRPDEDPSSVPISFYALWAPGYSFEAGIGIDFKKPESGELVEIQADLRAAYFIQDKDLWFLEVGNPANPVTIRALSLFMAKYYMVLNSKGIDVGLEINIGESRKYGPLSATIKAYLKSRGQWSCLLYTSPSPRDRQKSRMPSSA